MYGATVAAKQRIVEKSTNDRTNRKHSRQPDYSGNTILVFPIHPWRGQRTIKKAAAIFAWYVENEIKQKITVNKKIVVENKRLLYKARFS